MPELGGEFGAQVLAAAAPLARRHNLVTGQRRRAAETCCGTRPVPLSTMGRGLDAGPGLLPGRRSRRPARGQPRAGPGGATAGAATAAATNPETALRPGAVLRARRAAGQPAAGSCCSARGWRLAQPAALVGAARRRHRAGRELPAGGRARAPRGDRPAGQPGTRSGRRAGAGRPPGPARGIRRLQHEVVVAVRLDAARAARSPTAAAPPRNSRSTSARAGGRSPSCWPAPSASTRAGCASCCRRSWPAPSSPSRSSAGTSRARQPSAIGRAGRRGRR